MKRTLFLLLLWVGVSCLLAQPHERMIKVIVIPNHADWSYRVGEEAEFHVKVLKNHVCMKGVKLEYQISEDMMAVRKKGNLILTDEVCCIKLGTMRQPGFLRCRVFVKDAGQVYEGCATAAFDPVKIRPTTEFPFDFIEFWEDAKTENAKIPIDPKLRLLAGRCTSKVNVYELNIQNYRLGSRIYGILCVPKQKGRYPALLRVPGAGVRSYSGLVQDAEKGMITLEIGIHGIPVTMENSFYNDLLSGALHNYQYFNWEHRDSVYYKRVYLGCFRAVDYIFTMNEFDGTNIGVLGISQGGALAIATAALDKRVKGLVAFYPALCDLTGYLHGRAGGWPHLFKNPSDVGIVKRQIQTSRYYDTVNFAKILKTTGFYFWGYNDRVCPPTSTFSAYNVISAPKQLKIMEECTHFAYPELWFQAKEWMDTVLGVKKE